MPVPQDEEEDDDERRVAKGRAELSAAVLEVAQATRRPRPIHAILSTEAIRSRFWVQEDSDAEDQPILVSPPSSPIPTAKENDPSSPTTVEFIKKAMDARVERALVFTIDLPDTRIYYRSTH
ncbi:hypothetical protein BDA96_03G151700 [Sorghum bicolor]|jgi:hypothetical protein|uniref:Uncharacterized protein n=2 Tax=Sorghum bicolor TaxID=4558 RepID=A0A921UPY1_SORBI|nr:hypothetical protein BDA96_03G151700 [Sorghum bicolor]KXG32366.1 hypothetical protein SORBI_3003G144100 [Sorghum bicolor]